MFRVQWRAPEKALGILEMWVTFGCHLCNIHGYSGMVSALCILISDLPLVKLSVIVGWLEKSIILWFIVVTRVGKVQFVSRKLKMNSSVKIQCIPSSGVAVAKATGTDLGEQWNGLLTQLSWLFSDHGLVLEEDGIADHLQRVRHLLWQVSTPNRRYVCRHHASLPPPTAPWHRYYVHTHFKGAEDSESLTSLQSQGSNTGAQTPGPVSLYPL